MSSSHRNGRRNAGTTIVPAPTFYVEAASSASIASSSKRGRRKSRSPGGQQRVPVTEVLNIGKKKRSIPSLSAHTDDMAVDRGRKVKPKATTPLTQSRFAVENANTNMAPQRTFKKEKDRSKSRDLHHHRKHLLAQSESGFESQNDVETHSDVAGTLPGLEVTRLKKEIEVLKKVRSYLISKFGLYLWAVQQLHDNKKTIKKQNKVGLSLIVIMDAC